MIGILLVVFIIVCFVIIGDAKHLDLVKDHKWMLLAPIGLVIVSIISMVLSIDAVVPDGENITKLVKVTNQDTDEDFYWNLVIDKWRDADQTDNSIHEYDAYEVVGYVSPETGKRVDLEPEDYNTFGREVTFYENTNDGWDTSYTAVVEKADVEISFVEKMKRHKISGYIYFILYIALAVYSGIIAYKIFISLKNDVVED